MPAAETSFVSAAILLPRIEKAQNSFAILTAAGHSTQAERPFQRAVSL